MKVVIAMYDTVAEIFTPPMFVPSVGVAYRDLQDVAARGGEGNVLAAHGGDFQVFQLGTYDEQTGVFSPLPRPVLLVEVSALLKKE